MAEGFDPDAQLEKTYLAGPTTKTPRRLRLSSLLAVILFVLVGGVGGYFWHQQGWWPAESESESVALGLQPDETTAESILDSPGSMPLDALLDWCGSGTTQGQVRRDLRDLLVENGVLPDSTLNTPPFQEVQGWSEDFPLQFLNACVDVSHNFSAERYGLWEATGEAGRSWAYIKRHLADTENVWCYDHEDAWVSAADTLFPGAPNRSETDFGIVNLWFVENPDDAVRACQVAFEVRFQ